MKKKIFNFGVKISLLLGSVLCIFPLHGEERDEIESRARVESRVGVDFQPFYLFSSFRDDVLKESLSMDKAVTSRFGGALHFKYGFTFPGSFIQGKLYPDVRQGIGTGVNFFQYPKSVGVPVEVYLFQGAPIVRFNRKISLDYEWNFGASFGWKPCDGVSARSNLITGSRANAYINLGIGLRWKLKHGFELLTGMEITHFSNGNTSFPNPGINSLGLRIGLTRCLGGTGQYFSGADESHSLDTSITKEMTVRDSEGESLVKKISYDLTGYGAWRKRVYRGGETPVLLKGRYAIAGLNFAPMWNVNRFFRTGIAADFQWDESSDLKNYYIGGTTTDDIRFSRGSFIHQIGVGLSARAELVMPFFSVNVGIGYNFVGPTEARATYQMANLKIYINRAFYLNVGYQLQNFQRQNNLMLGLGYSFRSPRHPSTSIIGSLRD